MTERLREEMLRVGDTAPPIHVPGDLWALGRRARRRDRLVSGVVALSVIGLILAVSMLGWLGLGGRGDVAPVSPAGDEGAVPSTLYGVPERLTSNEEAGTVWKSNVAEADLAIGRGSVAFAAGGSPLPVVVTAADGRYHPLVLPGWIGSTIAGAMMNPAVPLALSPDGRQLAYAWVEFSGRRWRARASACSTWSVATCGASRSRVRPHDRLAGRRTVGGWCGAASSRRTGRSRASADATSLLVGALRRMRLSASRFR
ncbi:hypothetical protein [Nocardioides cavernaquae]|uniref:hypothetical protein n=1 Tax=Nocardioides cavernaquae TaxID=2321396 RepID=UPI0015FF7FEB|nr:hypothetical protein [Nocardioides cavernaquae]